MLLQGAYRVLAVTLHFIDTVNVQNGDLIAEKVSNLDNLSLRKARMKRD
jgi:hypothetical protein